MSFQDRSFADSVELKKTIVHFANNLFDNISSLSPQKAYNPNSVDNLDDNNIHNNVSIVDVYVQLRSNLDISLEIRENELVGITGVLSGQELCKVAMVCGATTESNTCSMNIDIPFYELLKEKIQELLLSGRVANGLHLIPRPLISSPIWSNGIKNNIGTLEVPSALNAFKHTVLLGPPGSGKSTIAKFIACCHLNEFCKLENKSSRDNNISPDTLGVWQSTSLLPVFIELKNFITDDLVSIDSEKIGVDVFLDYLKTSFLSDSNSLYEYYIAEMYNGKVIFIFDGLDEVPVYFDIKNSLDIRRKQIRSLMSSLSGRFQNCKIIVTSRPAGYSGWTLQNFDVLRVLPLNHQESHTLIKSHYLGIGLSEDEASDNANNLSEQLSNVPEGLRKQPLFIVLLAYLFLEYKGDNLPKQRGKLLDYSIKLLLHSWPLSRFKRINTLTELLQCKEEELYRSLEIIAYKSLTNQAISRSSSEDIDIPRGLVLDELYEIGNHVNPTILLSFISNHAGLLSSPSSRKYRFAHRLFQEYLAASYLCTNEIEIGKKLISLIDSDEVSWLEVTLLIGDILTNTKRQHEIWNVIGNFLSTKKSLFTWLSSKLYLDQNMDKFKDDLVADFVIKEMEEVFQKELVSKHLSVQKKVDIGEGLSVIGDPRRGVGLRNNIPDIFWIPVPTGNVDLGLSMSQYNKLKPKGSGSWDLSREMPQKVVRVRGFCVSKYPITVTQYQAFVDDTDGYFYDQWWCENGIVWREKNSPAPIFPKRERNKPQTYVTWYEAVAFCNWISKKLNKKIKLPSEAEWERAAKHGKNRIYPWGDATERRAANTLELSIGKVIPVGCFDEMNTDFQSKPSDMIGNVWEWCSSIIETDSGEKFNYPYVESDGRENMTCGDEVMRATRGGYHGNDLLLARSSYRGRDIPSARLGRQGFRIVYYT